MLVYGGESCDHTRFHSETGRSRGSLHTCFFHGRPDSAPITCEYIVKVGFGSCSKIQSSMPWCSTLRSSQLCAWLTSWQLQLVPGMMEIPKPTYKLFYKSHSLYDWAVPVGTSRYSWIQKKRWGYSKMRDDDTPLWQTICLCTCLWDSTGNVQTMVQGERSLVGILPAKNLSNMWMSIAAIDFRTNACKFQRAYFVHSDWQVCI